MDKTLFSAPKHPAEVDDIYHLLNLSNIGNVLYWREFFAITKSVPGNIVECGIGRGRSLTILSALNYILSPAEGGGRKIFGYDSFEGFDNPSDEDNSTRKPQKGEWSHSPSGKYKYSPQFIESVLTKADIPNVASTLRLKKGYFSESLKDYDAGPIAILNVDSDLYQPYKDTLQCLFKYVSIGGVVTFDDFLLDKPKDEKFPGARKAVEEFMESRPEKLRASIRGTPYLVKERN